MSQHADLTKTIVAKAIKSNWNAQETCEHYSSVLWAAEYEDELRNPEHIIDMAKYMLTQKDGLYGPSHQNIVGWLADNIDDLNFAKRNFGS